MAEKLWIDLVNPDPATVASALPEGVHRTALGRLLAPVHHADDPRPRLEAHGEYVFGVIVMPVAYTDGEVIIEEIDLVATLDTLVTVRKRQAPSGATGTGESTDSRAGEERRPVASPAFAVYQLFDEAAERFLSMADDFDADIDMLEDEVAAAAAADVRDRISRLRHGILQLRRVLAPTRDAARAVLDNRLDLDGPAELFDRDAEIHFADAYDKLLRATDGLDLSRDLLAGVRDYHQAQVANDQNEVMKRLTVIASMLLLPTFIVGLYGQNVKGVPEFHMRFGYAWSWAVILLTTVGQIIYFRRKRWI